MYHVGKVVVVHTPGKIFSPAFCKRRSISWTYLRDHAHTSLMQNKVNINNHCTVSWRNTKVRPHDVESLFLYRQNISTPSSVHTSMKIHSSNHQEFGILCHKVSVQWLDRCPILPQTSWLFVPAEITKGPVFGYEPWRHTYVEYDYQISKDEFSE